MAGLQDDYFGYVHATRPQYVNDAYTFLCKLKNKRDYDANVQTGSKTFFNEKPTIKFTT